MSRCNPGETHKGKGRKMISNAKLAEKRKLQKKYHDNLYTPLVGVMIEDRRLRPCDPGYYRKVDTVRFPDGVQAFRAIAAKWLGNNYELSTRCSYYTAHTSDGVYLTLD